MRASGVAGGLLAVLTAAALAASDPAPPSDRDSASLAQQLAMLEHRAGASAPGLLPLIARLAQLRYQQAALAEATALRRRALSIAISAYGNGSVPAAEAMAALARLYVERRRYLDAEPLAITAVVIVRDRLGEGAAALASALADRARIALAVGERRQARRWAEQAIAIDRRTIGAPQSDRLRVLGAVLATDGKFAEAEAALEQAVALDRGREDTLSLARSLAGLATAKLRQDQFAAALPAIEEATALDQQRLAAQHPLIAEDFHNLGLVYLGLNRIADAARVLRLAAAALEREVGRETPALAYVQLDLARAEHALGHDQEARSLFAAARRTLNAAEDEERDRQRHT